MKQDNQRQFENLVRLIHAGFEYQIVVFRVDGGHMIAQGKDSQFRPTLRRFLFRLKSFFWFLIQGSDGGQFEDIEVTEIILGVGESYDVVINLPRGTFDPIIVR